MAETTKTKPEETKKEEEVVALSPTEYFNKVKDMKHQTTEDDIRVVLENCLVLLEKPKITGQAKMAKKIYEQAQILLREIDAVHGGFDTYVLQEDILYYIDKISKKEVKIIELENYTREIPDDVCDKLVAAKKYFDKFFILFTDYTGEEERRVEKEKRDKDPILFGTFNYPGKTDTPTGRMYFIADWVDKYCDLTLEQMVMQYESERKEGMTYACKIPDTLDGLKEAFRLYEEKDVSKTEYAINRANIHINTVSGTNERDEEKEPTKKKRTIGRPRKKKSE